MFIDSDQANWYTVCSGYNGGISVTLWVVVSRLCA